MPDDLVITEEDVGLPARRPNLNPFQLAVELEQLLSFQEDAETDEEKVAADTALAEYVKREVQKVDAIRSYLFYAEAMAAAAKAERDRQAEMAREWSSRYDRVKEAAKLTMEMLGLKKIQGKLGTLSLRGNGGRQPVEVTRPDILPDDLVDVTVRLPLSYWKAIVGAVGETLALPEPKDAAPALVRIHDALQADGVPGARLLERGTHLEVK